jgi:hypothetical protein
MKSSNDLPFNKKNFLILKKERDMLKITLKYISEENESLKNELNDMKITAKKNKDMLKEYVTQITNKDKLFEKMASTIEQLKSRLKAMEQFKKEKETIKNNNNYLFSEHFTNNHSTTTTSNNFTLNNILGTTSGENLSFGFNILNNGHKNKISKNIFTDNKTNKSMCNIHMEKKNFNILNYKNNFETNKYIYDTNNAKDKLISKININKNNININKDENTESFQYFIERQKNIMEEINLIKDDIQFLMENKSRSKLIDKLNQSISAMNSLNSSFCSENKNNDENNNINKDNFNNSFISDNNLNNSYLSQNISNLSVTYYGADQNMLRDLNYALNTNSTNNKKKEKKILDIKERYRINDNFSDFILKTNSKKDILFFIDGKENVWEIVRRKDLNVEQLNNDKEVKLKSVVDLLENDKSKIFFENNFLKDNKNIIDNNKLDNKLIDIEIKEPYNNIFK